MTLEVRTLRHFVTVAETLNFRLAAERLHLTQPALTRSIAGLERQLGLLLFHRDKRRVALTEDGADLLIRARTILAGVDDFAFAAHALSTASQSTLQIGVYGDGLAQLTHPILMEFRRRYPDARLLVRDADFQRGIEPVLSGTFRAALLRAPTALPELRLIPLFLEPVVVGLPLGHRLSARPEVDVEDLFDDPWVTFPPATPGAWAAQWLVEDRRKGAKPVIGTYARSEYELYAAIAYGGQVGILPRSVLDLRPHPGIVAVPVRDFPPLTAAVALPVHDAEPLAVALATVASEVAAQNLHLVAGAIPIPDDESRLGARTVS